MYESTLGAFYLLLKKIESVFLFSIKTDWADAVTLGKFKNCFVNNTSGNNVAFDEVSFWPEDKNLQHVVAILQSRLVAKDDRFDIEFCISSKKNVVPRLVATLGEAILENLYRDTTYGDVSFLFTNDTNPPSAPAATSGSRKKGGKKSAKTQHHVITLKAHKLVLSQWSYFKAMFKGGFAESQPCEQQIRIQDTKFRTFKLLLRFLYTGQLGKNHEPAVPFSNKLEDNEEALLEDLFLAAD
ncbi:hypothetical protein BG006_004962 [Podila minutissima]|uniref:BTB domain-containing protein n=1 Tax=Podila minutissima TaxID=64525 RepID=A0A9P5SN72_9FUNG|nr:hypothetical protein BG006_004962 [Podila minutissima]